MATQVKKTRGRQKIEMKKIEDEEDRLITFSKRKAGIIRKAAEISVMCGAKTAFIIFSSTGKAYSFGHPSVKFVTDKFLNRPEDGRPEEQQSDNIQSLVESHRDNKINKLTEQYNALVQEVESEKRRQMLKRQERLRTQKSWWEQDVNLLAGSDEVMKFNESIAEFQNQLRIQMNNLKKKKTTQYSSSSASAAAALDVNQMKNSSFMASIGPSTDLQLYPSATLVHPSSASAMQQHLFNRSISLPYRSPAPIVQQPTLNLFNCPIGAGSSGAGPSASGGGSSCGNSSNSVRCACCACRIDSSHDRRHGAGGDEHDHGHL